jgi:hypothetical protein
MQAGRRALLSWRVHVKREASLCMFYCSEVLTVYANDWRMYDARMLQPVMCVISHALDAPA